MGAKLGHNPDQCNGNVISDCRWTGTTMSCFALFVKPQPWLYAMALPFCVLINMLIVQIMQTMSFICLSPMRTCRLLADWRSNTIVLAAMCGRSAVGPRRPRVFQMFPSVKKTSPFHSYASGGAYSWWPRTRHTCFIRSLVEHWKCITKKFHFTDILTNIANSTIPKSKPRSKKTWSCLAKWWMHELHS